MDARILHVDPASPEPIYRQIAEQLRRLVAAGQLRPGHGLPSVREVAAAHAINPMTVSRAYSQLESEGVLERLRGKGMAVAARGGRGDSVAARHCRELELPAERVLARLRQLLGEDPT